MRCIYSVYWVVVKKTCFAHFCKLVDRTYLFTCNMIIPRGANTGVWKRWRDKHYNRYSAEVSRDAECCNTNKRWWIENDLSRGWTKILKMENNHIMLLDSWIFRRIQRWLQDGTLNYNVEKDTLSLMISVCTGWQETVCLSFHINKNLI